MERRNYVQTVDQSKSYLGVIVNMREKEYQYAWFI